MFQFVMQHRNSRGHPFEDRARVSDDGHVFAVADGVTQDAYSPGDFPAGSGAACAAQLFCDIALTELRHNSHGSAGDQLRAAFDKVNAAVNELNNAERPATARDYFDNNLYGAVGVSGFVCASSHVHYGYVGDCGLMILSPTGALLLQTSDEVAVVERYMTARNILSLRERRFVQRSLLRNSKSDTEGGYGTFTGEAGVRHYYRFGEHNLRQGECAVAYSDGFLPYIQNGDVLDILARANTLGATVVEASLRALFDRTAAEDKDTFGDDKSLVLLAL